MNTKPEIGYGWIECGSDDPAREEYLCRCGCIPAEPGTWLNDNSPAGGEECGQHWCKRPTPPDAKTWAASEWEIVPEGELETEDMLFNRTNQPTVWESNSDLVFTPEECGWYSKMGTTVHTFIRHKSAPTAQAPATGWISVKDRLPEGSDKTRWLCWFDYGQAQPQTTKQIREAGTASCLTHWMPLPTPPVPEKSAAEKAWEKYTSTDLWKISDKKDSFLAGYEAGKAAQ